MPNKAKGEIRLTYDPTYYPTKIKQWREQHPIHYVININGKQYAFTKDKISIKVK